MPDEELELIFRTIYGLLLVCLIAWALHKIFAQGKEHDERRDEC